MLGHIRLTHRKVAFLFTWTLAEVCSRLYFEHFLLLYSLEVCNLPPLKIFSPHTGEKLLWFQGQLDPAKTTYTKKDACDIIERWSFIHFIIVKYLNFRVVYLFHQVSNN